MKFLITLITLGFAGYGLWWINSTHPEIRDHVEDFLDSGYFHTLEVRYSANQIMEAHRKELLKDNRHKYLEPVLQFYPYVLLEVKYILSEEKTSEGLMLWDLTDGEMVIDTKDWEKTHGFADCINAGTERHEFKVINALAKRGGTIDREGLSKALHVENDILDSWIDACRRKKLIVQSGNKYRLHLENPKLKTIPQTNIDERLVTKSHKKAIRLKKHFSISQIDKLAKSAFGNDFAIRKTTDVYLPVHSIIVQNPDGSVHTSHWNALNGKRLSQTCYVE